jgi:phage FluMu gp28-like protein
MRTKRKPRRTGTTVSPLDLLLPYQKRWVNDLSRFKIGCQARQTGKSFQTACEAISSAFTDPGTKWVCLSSGERQALEWMEKAKEWAEAYRLAIESYAEDREISQALLRVAEIRFANGSRVIAIPANPATARGYSANVILDEFAYHEEPDLIWAAMFPALTNPLAGTFMNRARAMFEGDKSNHSRRMKIRVVSTFNGRNNKFFNLWEKRKENGYSGHFITIYDAAEEIKRAIESGLFPESMRINPEELRAGLDDPDCWAQEYECEPIDTSNVLLPYELIAHAETIEATEFIEPEFFESRRQIFCGIDFGRSNDPTVCWTLEQLGDTLWTREVLVLDKMDTPNQNAILASRIKGSRRTVVDYTGPGVGFGDYAVKEQGCGLWKPEEHKFGKVELFTFTPKSKRLLFPLLRRRFESPCRIRIPVSRMVREDLHAMQQVVNKGEYSYWAPRTREGHSDRCTALALAVRAAGEARAGAIRDTTLIHFGMPAPTRLGHFEPMRLES